MKRRKSSGDCRQPQLAIIPVSGGEPVRTFSLMQGTVQNPQGAYIHWTSDSRDIDYFRMVKGVTNIWTQPLAGGPPKQMKLFTSGRIFNFAWSPKGDLALARGTDSSDVLPLRNSQ